MANLTEDQIDRFRAIGKASRALGEEYAKGNGPDPVSGSTFQGGKPMCTWGQVLYKAGMKPLANYSTGSNLGALSQFITDTTQCNGLGNKVSTVVDGFMTSKEISYDLTKINKAAGDIQHANDPAPTAAARKANTHKLLIALADEIDTLFGERKAEQPLDFESAAEQYLQDLIMGNA